jgi:hypothetical protein
MNASEETTMMTIDDRRAAGSGDVTAAKPNVALSSLSD